MIKTVIFKDDKNHIFYDLCNGSMFEIYYNNFNDIVITITNCTPIVKNGKVSKILNGDELVTLKTIITKTEINFLRKSGITIDIILDKIINEYKINKNFYVV